MNEWEPYIPRGPQMRIAETSCCGEYELASEGGQYLVLRRTAGVYEETGRGRYVYATALYILLTSWHVCPETEISVPRQAPATPQAGPIPSARSPPTVVPSTGNLTTSQASTITS